MATREYTAMELLIMDSREYESFDPEGAWAARCYAAQQYVPSKKKRKSRAIKN